MDDERDERHFMEDLLKPEGKQFKDEAEEAAWWEQNQDALAREFEGAAQDGTLGHGSVAKKAAEGE